MAIGKSMRRWLACSEGYINRVHLNSCIFQEGILILLKFFRDVTVMYIAYKKKQPYAASWSASLIENVWNFQKNIAFLSLQRLFYQWTFQYIV